MPGSPGRPIDPLTANPIKAESVREPFEKATEADLVKRFPGWNDRETAKVVIERANNAVRRAEAHRSGKVGAATETPSRDLVPPPPGGQPPPDRARINSEKVEAANSKFDLRKQRIETAKERIFKKIETRKYQPRVLSQTQIDHADRVKRAAAIKAARDGREEFTRAARGR